MRQNLTRFDENNVEVLAPAHINVEGLLQALRREHVEINPGARFQIVVAEVPFEAGLADVDAQCRNLRRPWLLVTLAGELAGAGPLFLPDQGPCWRCLIRRMWLNGQPAAAAPARWDTTGIFRAAAREAALWLRAGSCRVLGARVMGGGETHPLIACCPDCMTVAPPRKARRESMVSPYTGVAAYVEVSEAAAGLFRSRGALSQALVPDRTGAFLPEERIEVDGKGQTAEEAVRSCLGEAAERYSLLFHGGERRIRATLGELGPTAIDPRTILLYSDRQYERREWWRRRYGNFHWPGEPFDETKATDWVEGQDATNGASCWLPAEHCLLGYGGTFAQADSNGCAGGETRWRAARGALLELIERDAVAIWWYNRLRRPQVEWASVASERLEKLARALRRLKRRFWLLDVTSDLQIPVYVAVSCGPDGGRVMLGSGAGVQPETAAWRAMSEMAVHVLDLTNASAAPAGGNEQAFWNWWRRSSLKDYPYLAPLSTVVPPPAGPRPAKQEFELCLRRLRAAGLRAFLYDHTRQDLKIPVLRAVVPGLRHWWARFAPGRLYQIPVQMGWRAKPLRERDLNPQPYFL